MYFLRRLLSLPPLLLLIAFLAFLLIRAAPGGPFDRERAPASPEIERQLRLKYHLDESVTKQFGRFLGGLLRGDFGTSLKYRNHSVSDVIGQGLPVSLALGLLAFSVALGTGIPAGCWSAIRRGRWDEYAVSFLSLLAVCVPGFVIAPILIILFAIEWRWLPVGAWSTPWHAMLPVLALGLYFAGKIARLMREGMLNTLHAEFILTARAKGLSETAVFGRHALRLAVLPVVAYSGPMLADLLTGAFIIETIFQIPGLGTFLVNGSLNRDYTLVVGLVILYAVLLVFLNLVVDYLHAALDPRVRF